MGVSGDVHRLSAALEVKKTIKSVELLINNYLICILHTFSPTFSRARLQHILYIHLQIAAQQSELHMHADAAQR